MIGPDIEFFKSCVFCLIYKKSLFNGIHIARQPDTLLIALIIDKAPRANPLLKVNSFHARSYFFYNSTLWRVQGIDFLLHKEFPCWVM